MDTKENSKIDNEEKITASNFIRSIIDRDLANGKHKSIITRFPPEPNGYLHIGHAKSICLNFGLARDYQGRCILRFDDSNPVKEDVEYVDSIMEDIKWLGFEWANIYYVSRPIGNRGVRKHSGGQQNGELRDHRGRGAAARRDPTERQGR